MADTPLLIVAVSIWSYWAGVFLMSLRSRLLHRHAAGLVPNTRSEQLLWLIWVPVIIAWNALPALTSKEHWLLELPTWAVEYAAVVSIRWIAAMLAACAFFATIVCWIAMGRSWSVATLKENQQLVTGGPFAIARHPIYALSMLLMLCTLIVLPTLLMLVLAILHVALFQFKANTEEQHMLAQHGEAYKQYMQRVGRFLPRLRR